MSDFSVFEARRSVRRFTEQSVPEALVERLLRDAMAAPSAMNKQPWEFVVVRDPLQLQAVKKSLPYAAYNAPLIIAVLGNQKRCMPGLQSFWVQDCSAAMQNLLLSAAMNGLGAVWCGVYPVQANVARVSEVLRLPGHVLPLGVALVGYPDKPPEALSRYDQSRVFQEAYPGGGGGRRGKRLTQRAVEALRITAREDAP